jgi:hypothetical protein
MDTNETGWDLQLENGLRVGQAGDAMWVPTYTTVPPELIALIPSDADVVMGDTFPEELTVNCAHLVLPTPNDTDEHIITMEGRLRAGQILVIHLSTTFGLVTEGFNVKLRFANLLIASPNGATAPVDTQVTFTTLNQQVTLMGIQPLRPSLYAAQSKVISAMGYGDAEPPKINILIG